MGTELETISGESAELIEAAKGGIDAGELVVPMLKVMQPLSNEVGEGKAQPGQLVHSLTGQSYGTSVGLIVVRAFKGRAWQPEPGKLLVADGPLVPWRDHPCNGERFVDCYDAEEQYRAAVNAEEHPWGKGPGISTTYNFVGLVLPEDGELENFPVRLSLMRAAGAKAGRKLMTLLQISRAPWDNLYTIQTQRTQNAAGQPYHRADIDQARITTADERQLAVTIAQAVASVALSAEVEADPDPGVAPAPEASGGLDV
jgi:hypothetical protein